MKMPARTREPFAIAGTTCQYRCDQHPFAPTTVTFVRSAAPYALPD